MQRAACREEPTQKFFLDLLKASERGLDTAGEIWSEFQHSEICD